MSTSALRSLALIEAIAGSDEPVGPMTLAASLGLDKSTASRLLAQLEENGYLRRENGSRKYVIGYRTLGVATRVLAGAELTAIAAPVLRTLRDLSLETTSLHVREGDYRVCVGGAEGIAVIRRGLHLGERVHLFDGPASKIILAFLDTSESERILAGVRPEAERDAIRQQCAIARDEGFMRTMHDRTPNVAAICAPFFDANGVAGSVSIGGNADDATAARIDGALADLIEGCRQISLTLGAAVGSA